MDRFYTLYTTIKWLPEILYVIFTLLVILLALNIKRIIYLIKWLFEAIKRVIERIVSAYETIRKRNIEE